ncbi:hypothetical protein N5C54_06620 [Pseudomonas chengduensis]|nr:hypothetical protein [Pseudomonas chengduensis]MDH0957449.1 hypothetical protein [Pseudomonas chengduensis]
MSLASRRRAIYTGLSSHFSGDELLAVLCLWEDRYAEKPPFALNEFLAEVATARGQRLERAKLYRELVGALTGPLSALLPDPGPELLAWRQRRGVAVPEGQQAQQARHSFCLLSKALLNALGASRSESLRRFAADNLGGMQVDEARRLGLRAWLLQGDEQGLLGLTPAQLSKMLNLLYIGLCEFLGPVAADRLLSQCVDQVESLHPAYPIRQLL